MTDLMKYLCAGALASSLVLAGCGSESSETGAQGHAHDDGHDHTGGDHDDHDHADADHADDEHGDEVSLGAVQIGDLEVQLAQGHGQIEPGKELHLVVKLPYSDSGASVVRAWLGSEDRFASVVAKGEYAASHDGYEVHAIAPDPLPENTMWWVEIEKPDGQKVLGSAKPH